jgi:hypothetical protein
MTELEAFGAHCREMATAQHRPDRYCGQAYRRALAEWAASGKGEKPLPCPGCVTALDRAIWQRLADEVSAYLTTEPEETHELPLGP